MYNIEMCVWPVQRVVNSCQRPCIGHTSLIAWRNAQMWFGKADRNLCVELGGERGWAMCVLGSFCWTWDCNFDKCYIILTQVQWSCNFVFKWPQYCIQMHAGKISEPKDKVWWNQKTNKQTNKQTNKNESKNKTKLNKKENKSNN